MTKKYLYIPIFPFLSTESDLIEIMEANGYSLILGNREEGYKLDKAAMKRATYVIAGLENYGRRQLEDCENLIALSRVGVGVDNISLGECAFRSIHVYKTSDQPSVAVSELCVANILNLLRQIIPMSNSLKDSTNFSIQGRDLKGLTCGIVGLGSIGKELAIRLNSFGVKLIACSRSFPDNFASLYGIELVSIEELFEQSDVISVHLPLEKTTQNLIGEPLLKKVRHGSILINTSRAGVIDSLALLEALKSGALAGVALDVFDEDEAMESFRQMDNVILTPHVGSHTRETRLKMERMALLNLLWDIKQRTKKLVVTEAVADEIRNLPKNNRVI